MLKHICLLPIFLVFFHSYLNNTEVKNKYNKFTITIKQQKETRFIDNNYDRQKFNNIIEFAITNKLYQKPLEIMMQQIAKQFLGSEYKAGLLDQTNQENLIVSLTQFDCFLFVETVLGLVRGIEVKDYTYTTFVNHIQEQRYRNRDINYCDRLHYFSDWINRNQQKGIVTNLTNSLGGIPLHKKINFMTANRTKYPQLANNEDNYQCIKQVEENLNQLNLTYIPTNKIKSIYPQLKSGDIIGIVTQIEGLDVTHTGLIYQQDHEVGLIHASPVGQVTIAKDLQIYVQNVPKAIGIFVVRPIAPR